MIYDWQPNKTYSIIPISTKTNEGLSDFVKQLNSQKIDSSSWNTLGTKMVLHETNIKFIGNYTHNDNLVIGKSSDFQVFNHFDYLQILSQLLYYNN